MIGWAPFLLTGMAAALLALVAIDASSAPVASHISSHTAWLWLHEALNAVVHWLSHFGVQDWVLVGVTAYLLAWGLVRPFAFVRLGTIQITDVSCDDDTLGPAAAKAALQQAFAAFGLLPASSVPTGSPSVASIVDVISKAPIPQANWLGPLIGLIPWPGSSTTFQISGNLRRTGAGEQAPVSFAYEVLCTGPRRSRHLAEADGADTTEAIANASLEIYRKIGETAPRLYPTWARWHCTEALVTYLDGVDSERCKQYEEAHGRYMAACDADPDNMIARLRAANCLERMATGAEDPELRLQRQVETLAAYTSIRIRRDSIFEAGFRASVLLSVLASEPPEKLQDCSLLEATIARLERAMSDTADPGASPWETLMRWRRSRWRRLRLGSEPTPNARLEAAALEEARRARHQLRPFRTLWHEYRLRHRFEPTGRDRRQLRKALGISKMAQQARSEHRRGARSDAPPWAGGSASIVRQWRWQMLVKWHYLACRWHVAGWAAHYNAACFYALLPRATQPRGRRLRRRALKHLGFALDQADGALDCAYVRDEDPDLQALRQHETQRFADVLSRVCQDELVIHYKALEADATWQLRAWGPATRTESDRDDTRLAPVRATAGKVTFRVPIFDENRALCFCVDPHSVTGWQLIPATVLTAEIWVRAGDEPEIVDIDERPVPGVSLVVITPPALTSSPAPAPTSSR